MILKLGSLFDGISAFPYAAQLHDIMTIWASEIEPFPIRVSKKHFPKMVHLGDVTKINGAEIDPVDIISFGSPCQDLSVAGNQKGLEGERSGLFLDAIRICKEMREATNGNYPTFAIWENVPGAFSSNGGHDFRAVLKAFAETEIPMPLSGKWGSAGMVRGNGREMAWRVMDAQYWGVPQRRKRIFLVADFRGRRAGKILFESEGVSRNPQEGREAREDIAASAGDGTEKAIATNGLSIAAAEPLVYPRISGTLCASGAGLSRPAGMGSETDLIVCQPTYAFSAGQSEKAGSIGFGEEVSPTLRAGQSGTNMVPTLCEPIAFAANQRDEVRDLGNKSGAIQAQPGMKQQTVVAYPDPANPLLAKGNVSYRADMDNIVVSQNPVRIGYRVRRLTPVECLRLMGFPDWWLNIEGASDSAKYKAVGNSIAIPPLDFIFSRIKAVLQGA